MNTKGDSLLDIVNCVPMRMRKTGHFTQAVGRSKSQTAVTPFFEDGGDGSYLSAHLGVFPFLLCPSMLLLLICVGARNLQWDTIVWVPVRSFGAK